MVDTAWTPDSLPAWRDFVAWETVRPTVLSVRDRKALMPLRLEEYNDLRIQFVNALMVLPTPQLKSLIRQAQLVTGMNRGHQFTARQALAISGSQTLGKSTSAMYLGRTHERQERAKAGREKDESFAPVLYLSTPPQTSSKGLMTRFANTLGLPIRSRMNTDQIMDQVVKVIRDLGTSMVIIDEVQNLRTRAQVGMEAAAALKSFSERIPATFLFVGVDLAQSDFLGGPMGAQMTGRTSMVEMKPYSIGSSTLREDWEQLIALFEREFPLAEHEPGTLVEEAGWLHSVTGGVVGSLRTLLRKGQIAAITGGSERVNRQSLESTSPNYHSANESTTIADQAADQVRRTSA